MLLGRKVMTNLVSVLQSRDIILLTKILIAKAIVLPVIMNRFENWTIKKVECQSINALNYGAGEDS